MRYPILLIIILFSTFAFSKHYYASSNKEVKRYFEMIKSIENQLGNSLTPVLVSSNKLYVAWKSSKRKCHIVSVDENNVIERHKLSCRNALEIKPTLKGHDYLERIGLKELYNRVPSQLILENKDEFLVRRFNARKDMIDFDRKLFPEYSFPYHDLLLKTDYSLELIKTEQDIKLVSRIHNYDQHDFWLPKYEKKYSIEASLLKHTVAFENEDEFIVFFIPQKFSLLNQYYYSNEFSSNIPNDILFDYKGHSYCFWDYSFVDNDYDCYKLFTNHISQSKTNILRAIKINKNDQSIVIIKDGVEINN